MSEPLGFSEALTDRVSMAISAAFAGHDGSMPTRWLLVAECMEADGTMSVSMGYSAKLSGWEILGLAQYAGQMVQSSVIARTLRADEGDG